MIFFFCFLPCTIFFANTIQVGAGSYTTTLPSGQQGPSNSQNNPVVPSVTSQFNELAQTNKWWTSLIWKFDPTNPWSQNIFTHPFSFCAQAGGLQVGYPTQVALTPYAAGGDKPQKLQEYHYNHATDLTLGAVGLNAPATNLAAYSDWTATADWTSGGIDMQATIGKGLPFVFVTLNGGTAQITFPSAPTIWYNTAGVIGLTINGHNYGIFAPNGSAWNINSTTMTSNLNGKNYYSVAVLPDNTQTTLAFFRNHAYAFVTNTQVTWQYNAEASTVATNFTAQTVLKEAGPNNTNVNSTIMTLYRHQWMNSSTPLTNYTYTSPRGVLKVVEGNQFSTAIPFSGVLPFLPSVAQSGVDSYDPTALYGYVDQIYKLTPAQRWGNYPDTYFFGKSVARIAHLIPIAEQVQHTAAKNLFLAEVESNLESWLAVSTQRQFYYDSTWNTLIGFPASFGSNTQMNDHHFHYGYFIMAASIAAHYDSVWAEESNWGGMINMLIKDVANWDRQDPQFPFLRYFDVYEGHSWASGTADFSAGSNEESSSEEINFSSAVLLWGSITNNQDLINLGSYLYSTAATAIPQYWFDVDKQVFPQGFVPITLGMVWGNGGAYSIWWDGFVQELHGINFLPIQPGTLHLGAFPSYLQANQNFMLANAGNASPLDWIDIHMSIKALYDPIDAIAQFNQNSNYTPEQGETQAHTYHWIHNIDALGEVNENITANVPNYAVFTKNGVNSYVAYNPSTAATTVNFSDGTNLTVPARSVASSQGSTPPPPPPPPQFQEVVQQVGEVIFTFKPNWTPSFVNLNYSVNSSLQVVLPMTNSNNQWSAVVSGLQNGDQINYFYSYNSNGTTVNSAPEQHTYLCSATPPPPPPPTSYDDTPDYTLYVSYGSNTLSVKFVPKKTTHFVDLHYQIPGQVQQNVRMNLDSSGDWDYTIPNLNPNVAMQFSFTYDVNWSGVNSKVYTYTTP